MILDVIQYILIVLAYEKKSHSFGVFKRDFASVVSIILLLTLQCRRYEPDEQNLLGLFGKLFLRILAVFLETVLIFLQQLQFKVHTYSPILKNIAQCLQFSRILPRFSKFNNFSPEAGQVSLLWSVVTNANPLYTKSTNPPLEIFYQYFFHGKLGKYCNSLLCILIDAVFVFFLFCI